MMVIDNNGIKNPFYGRKHTVETKMKLSEIAKHRKVSSKTCLAISEGHKGNKNHMYGKHHTEESKRKISESKKGQRARLGSKHTPEAIAKMSAVKLGNRYSVGHIMPIESREKLSRERKGHYLEKQWNDPEYRARCIKAIRSAQNIHPNKPEKIMFEILNIVAPNEWEFVGDGQLIIGGKNPDFANVNGKKQIAECFGTYWHGERARCYEETEEGRIALFKKYGYDTLIIWENSLKNIPQVTEKIAEFCNSVHKE